MDPFRGRSQGIGAHKSFKFAKESVCFRVVFTKNKIQ